MKKKILPEINEHNIIETIEGLRGTVVHIYKNGNAIVVEFEKDITDIKVANVSAVFNGDGTQKICS